MADRLPARASACRLDDLPVCPVRRLPIPFATKINEDGSGQFNVNDTRRKLACGHHRLCGVGGGALPAEVVLLGVDQGGPPGRLVFSDPSMCEDCATVSLGLCPYIARPRVPARPAPPWVVPNAPDIPDDPSKPGWVWLLAAGSVMIGQPRRGGGVVAAFRPGPILAVRRFRYEGGGLAEVTPGR